MIMIMILILITIMMMMMMMMIMDFIVRVSFVIKYNARLQA